MFKKKYKHVLLILSVSLILAFVSVNHWFTDDSMLYFWDSFIMLDIQKTWGYVFYSWSSSIFPGSAPEGGWSLIPYWLLFSLGHKISSSISVAQEALYIGLIFTSLVSFYALLTHLINLVIEPGSKNPLLRIGSFIFAMLYTFNLYTFYYAYFMFNPGVFILAFLPLNILALLRIYPLKKAGSQKIDRKWILVFIATLFAMTSGFATYVFLAQYFIWIFVYLLFYFLISRTKLISVKALSLVLFLALIILSQWWWFFSALLTFEKRYLVEAQVGTTVWFDAGLLASRLLNSIRILGVTLASTNIFSWSKYYDNLWFTTPLFVFPFLIIYLLTKLSKLKNKPLIVFMLAIFLFSLFFVKFSNPPLSSIMKFAFYNIPFFGAFRGAYHKAGLFYIFSYFILSGIGFYYIHKLVIEKYKRPLSYIPLLIIVIVGIVVTGPFFLFYKDNIRKLDVFFNHKNYAISAKTKVPPEYYQLKSFFSPICPGKATVIIPRSGWISNAHWLKYNTSYAGIDIIAQIIRCEFLTTVVFIPKPEVSNQSLFFMLDQRDYKGVKNFLLQQQIGFVLIRKDHIPYSPTTWVYVDPQKISEDINKDSDFNKIFENDLVMLYEFKPLDKIYKKNGFALSHNAVYTDSTLTKNVGHAILAKHSMGSIGKMIVNTKDGFSKFKSYINAYVSESICSNCGKLKPNVEEKSAERLLTVYKDGEHECRTDTFDVETKVDKVTIKYKDGSVQDVTPSTRLYLSEGKYPISIDYKVKHVFDLPSLEIKAGALTEVPLGRISQGNYRMTYTVENKEFGIEAFMTAGQLSEEALEKREFGKEGNGVLFTNPVPLSGKKSDVERLFNAPEFSNDAYTLYFNSEKIISRPAKDIARITNLTINKVVDEESVAFSCSTSMGMDSDVDTLNIKVKQNSPVSYSVTLPEEFTKGFLTFNKSFDNNWIAYTTVNGKKYELDHQISGYANAWHIESPISRSITVEYKRQSMIEKNALVWIAAFPLLVLLYLKLIDRKTSNK